MRSLFAACFPAALGATSQFTLASNNAVTGVTITLAAVPGLASEFNALDFTENSTCGVSLGAGATVRDQYRSSRRPSRPSGMRAAVMTVTDAQGDAVTIISRGICFQRRKYHQQPDADAARQRRGLRLWQSFWLLQHAHRRNVRERRVYADEYFRQLR